MDSASATTAVECRDVENRWPLFVLFFLMAVGVAACFWLIAARTLTNTETVLMSILLTLLSIIGSWIASGYYSEYSFNKNQRVFALKAAEKVTNLSSELDRLSAFLQHELETDDYESVNHALQGRDQRIEGAIHIINTLKSANDKSLSDWHGVIGEEIIAKREREQQAREQQLKEIVERVESLHTHEFEFDDVPDESDRLLHGQLDAIRRDIRVLSGQVSGTPVRRKHKTRIEQPCPRCGETVRYIQRDREGSMKGVLCNECGARLYSLCINGSFFLRERIAVNESAACPVCHGSVAVHIDPLPGTSQSVVCETCQIKLMAVRRTDGITLRAIEVESETSLSEGFLEQVKAIMPPQPWPSGAARRVAEQLGASPKLVSRAVQQLVTRGVFKLQVDGKLYEPTAHQLPPVAPNENAT